MKRDKEESGPPTPLTYSASATPTAAPAADRPTSLSAPLPPPALALPASYPLAHISDTTSTSRVCTSAARYNATKLRPLWPPFRRNISLNFGFNYFLAEGSST